jgi:hypothetical protein
VSLQSLCILRQLSRWSSKLCNFLEKDTQRRDNRVAIDMCIADSSMCIEHIINPVQHRVKIIIGLKIEDSMKLIRGSLYMKFDFNRGVRLVNVDQSVA